MSTSTIGVFKSKKPLHALQPEELEIIANLITIRTALDGKAPSKAEILDMWEKFTE